MSCPRRSGVGSHGAEESIMAVGINGVMDEEREEGRGWAGGLRSRLKLSLGVALSDGAGR